MYFFLNSGSLEIGPGLGRMTRENRPEHDPGHG